MDKSPLDRSCPDVRQHRTGPTPQRFEQSVRRVFPKELDHCEELFLKGARVRLYCIASAYLDGVTKWQPRAHGLYWFVRPPVRGYYLPDLSTAGPGNTDTPVPGKFPTETASLLRRHCANLVLDDPVVCGLSMGLTVSVHIVTETQPTVVHLQLDEKGSSICCVRQAQ